MRNERTKEEKELNVQEGRTSLGDTDAVKFSGACFRAIFWAASLVSVQATASAAPSNVNLRVSHCPPQLNFHHETTEQDIQLANTYEPGDLKGAILSGRYPGSTRLQHDKSTAQAIKMSTKQAVS
jgi:hypothetical protein